MRDSILHHRRLSHRTYFLSPAKDRSNTWVSSLRKTRSNWFSQMISIWSNLVPSSTPSRDSTSQLETTTSESWRTAEDSALRAQTREVAKISKEQPRISRRLDATLPRLTNRLGATLEASWSEDLAPIILWLLAKKSLFTWLFHKWFYPSF